MLAGQVKKLLFLQEEISLFKTSAGFLLTQARPAGVIPNCKFSRGQGERWNYWICCDKHIHTMNHLHKWMFQVHSFSGQQNCPALKQQTRYNTTASICQTAMLYLQSSKYFVCRIIGILRLMAIPAPCYLNVKPYSPIGNQVVSFTNSLCIIISLLYIGPGICGQKSTESNLGNWQSCKPTVFRLLHKSH